MPREWMATLPEELKSEASLEVFEDVGALAKGFVETKKAMGKYSNSVIVPAEGTKDDAPEMVEFLTKLGRPKEAKEYEAVLPTGVKIDQQIVEDFKKTCHDLGMTKKQFQRAFGAQITKIQRDSEAAAKAQKERQLASETALRQQFGAKYDEKIQGIQKLVNTYGEGASQEDIDSIIARPGLVRMFSGVLEDLSEAALGKIGHVPGGALTPEEAKAEIEAIRTNKDHPMNAAFNNPNAGEKHREAKKRVDDLYQQAYPGKKKI